MTVLKAEEGRAVDQLESHLTVRLKDEVAGSRRKVLLCRVLDLLGSTPHSTPCVHDRRDLRVVGTVRATRVKEAGKLGSHLLRANTTDKALEY